LKRNSVTSHIQSCCTFMWRRDFDSNNLSLTFDYAVFTWAIFQQIYWQQCQATGSTVIAVPTYGGGRLTQGCKVK
jgi:hypothetical protein